jgi:hypothetical protein
VEWRAGTSSPGVVSAAYDLVENSIGAHSLKVKGRRFRLPLDELR